MITKVANIHYTKADENSVYIGIHSKWGNPFPISENCTREQAIAKYEAYLLGNAKLLAQLPELKDKTLMCFCTPKPCHGDVLARLINNTTTI